MKYGSDLCITFQLGLAGLPSFKYLRKFTVHIVSRTVVDQHLRHHTPPDPRAHGLAVDLASRLTVYLPAYKVRQSHIGNLQNVKEYVMGPFPPHGTIADHLRTSRQGTLQRGCA